MSATTGTARLVRLALRRDRILLPAWLVCAGVLTAGVVASVTELYATERDRLAAATFTAANPVARVFDGPASGTELGAMVMVEAYGVLAVLVALMSAQAVVRHTRLEEETGRAELVGSAVVGRQAMLTRALLVAAGADVAVGAAVAGVLLANGLAVAGSLLAGAALVGVGLVFAGVAAVTAQVLSTSRAANGAAGAVLGLAFVLRAVGDVAGDVAPGGVEVVSAWPSWLSPIGWGQQLRPFHHDTWPLLGLFVATALVLVAAAFLLAGTRDLGAGLVAPRPGPARAAPGLGRPVGLAWRQQRGILLGWTLGVAVLGVAFGAIGASADELIDVSPDLRDLLATMAPGGELVDQYFAFTLGFLGIAASGYTVQALLRMRAEETSGRLEAVLATATSRSRWLLSHAAVVGGGTLALLVLLGAAGATAYGLVTGDVAGGARGLLAGALVQAPAALALGSFVLLAVAQVPRGAAAVGWAALAAALVVGQLGTLLELPRAVANLSPFSHLPAVPAEPLGLLPLAALLGVALVLGTAAVAAFGRRDLVTAA